MNRFLRPLAAIAAVVILALGVWMLSHRQTPVRVAPASPPSAPLQLLLTPLTGDDKLDKEIRDLQARIKDAPEPNALIERLGWAFVAKARITSDPGFYKLSEAAADAITARDANDLGALLLRGHLDHAMHRFAEAENIARSLIARREFVFDYALLGDALMEQGKLNEAVDAYQKMVDRKPCLQTYSRVAYMRWLKGDLDGAIAATRLAISGGSPVDPEPVAWAYTRLALYQLQKSDLTSATSSVARSLDFVPQYAPALLMHGRVLLAAGKTADAVAHLTSAAAANPLPEYLWTLAEALRADGKGAEASKAEAKLRESGPANDPRTLALYLASRHEEGDLAVRLAADELQSRHDVFTHDALAWAEFAKGDVVAALTNSRLALAEGTRDARLLYHGGTIAAAAGETARALDLFNRTRSLQMTLLPSELSALTQQVSALVGSNAPVSSK